MMHSYQPLTLSETLFSRETRFARELYVHTYVHTSAFTLSVAVGCFHPPSVFFFFVEYLQNDSSYDADFFFLLFLELNREHFKNLSY